MILITSFIKEKYGRKVVLLLCILPVIIFSVLPLFSQDAATRDEEYISSLIKKSNGLGLYNDAYWHTILHYKKSLIHGYESQIDDPSFFFSADGKYNPEAELDETIRALFRPKEEGKTHPTEKFVSRYDWLKKKLDIDSEKIPYDGDKNFYSTYYGNVKPSKAAIIFPAGYMNSPASMFGHTFIIIESDSGSRLMASSVNYAANTDETFGPFFAFKGLLGLYKGNYSFLPYFQKIKEYSDSEMRNMWEYELNLNQEELERLIRHTVEMENIYSNYYFIDENCSYNLLYLVEAARPDTGITDAFGIGVEPIDTLRAARDTGLVSKRVFRPSIYSRMQYLRTLLTSDEQALIRDICKGQRDISEIDSINLTEEKKIILCDLGTDYLKFLLIKEEINEQEYRGRFLAVLKKRNLLGKYDPAKDMPVPFPPDESHKSRRLAPESGYGLEGWYSQLSYRQSCHEVMDPDDGYNMNSQIIFGNISGRYYYDDKRFVLQRLDVIDIVSLPPSDSFFISPCYEFKTGFIQNPSDGEKERLTYWFKAASGLSTLITEKSQVYFLAGLKTYFNPDYKNNTDLQAGGETGLLTIFGPWKNHMYVSAYHAPSGENHTRLSAGLSERIKVTESVSVATDYSYNYDYSYRWHEIDAKINYYF